MKALSVFAALSLTANVALLAWIVVLHREAEANDEAEKNLRALSVVTKSSDPILNEKLRGEFANAFKTGDAAALRDRLRAMGWPEDAVRAVVRTVIMRPLIDFQRSLTKSQQSKDPYQVIPTGMFSYSQLTKEQRAELRALNRQTNEQLTALLGLDPYDTNANRLSYLPQEKAEKLAALERDYADLRSQLIGEVQGFPLPSDDEKMAFLEKEKRQDIAALLSPDELKEYELRTSPTAERLRAQLRNFEVSPEEFKAIYDAQKAFDERMSSGPNDAASYSQAREQLAEQLRAEMGPDRYEAYQRAQNPDYRALEAAAQRFNLPQASVDQAFATRGQTISEAQRITTDPLMSDDQRTQALANLAVQTQDQLRSQLGPDAGDAYMRTNMHWLTSVQRGQSISIGPDGNVVTRPASRAGH